jgi:hypothetical protein
MRGIAALEIHVMLVNIQGVVKRAVPQLSAHFNRRWQLSDGFVGIVWARRHRSYRGLGSLPNHNRQVMIRGDTVSFHLKP